MAYDFTLTPVTKTRRNELWHLLVDIEFRWCRVIDNSGDVFDEFGIELAAARIVMPEFAGSHRWPLFRFPYESIEFKVDKRCLRFLNSLQIMAMIMQDRNDLCRELRKNALQVVFGVIILLTAVPMTVWLFISLDNEHDQKARFFGLICGSAFAGLLLIINPANSMSRLRKARRLQEKAGIEQDKWRILSRSRVKSLFATLIRIMKNTTCGIIILAAVAETCVAAPEPRLPSFLPAYYAPAFSSEGKALNLVSQGETNGVTQYVYSTVDETLALSVENIEGEKPKCHAVFNNILGYLNQLITSNTGAFVEITATEACAEVNRTNAAQTIITFVLPSSVQIWTFSGDPADRGPLTADFKTMGRWANRQRYEEALQAGNVSMGHWQKSIHDYAKDLLESGRTDDARVVLRNLLATAPFDYEAHLSLMENVPSVASATNSAKTVFHNAEDQIQILKAAQFMGIEPRTIDAFPPLATNETGLQVILIPLSPCNPWLLDDVAKLYERITEVPVKIRQLNEVWSWNTPERISRQRDIQGILVRLARQYIDFTGWSKEQYVQALSDAVKSEDALSKYWVGNFIENIRTEPGQYLADPYLHQLSNILKRYRSQDQRTMYVAITEANIYSGDNNYVFSLGRTDQGSAASIMSYHMMLGSTLRETYDSRQRLVERIAKELVPASIKLLNIPRSTDPSCPYSYSSGVDRLDQKTLTLSDEVKDALNKLRDPTTPATVQ